MEELDIVDLLFNAVFDTVTVGFVVQSVTSLEQREAVGVYSLP